MWGGGGQVGEFLYILTFLLGLLREKKKKKGKKIDRETKTSSQRQLKRERKKKKLRKLGTDAKTL